MNKNSPFFSVVIPVYNKGPHVSRAVKSVLSQSFTDYELIIIDDASTDNSLEEIQKFKDTRIRILHRKEPGPGGYAARNLGIREARAEWVAFLDADDEWHINHLKNYKEVIVKFQNAYILGCGWINYDSGKSENLFCLDSYYNKYNKCGTHQLSFSEYLQSEVDGFRPICTSVACFKKDILIKINGFPDGKCFRGGDVDTWIRAIGKAGCLAWSAHIGAIYYRDSINMVTKSNLFTAETERGTVKGMLIECKDKDISVLLKKFSNRRTLSAWQKNRKVSWHKNISLNKNLYLEVLTMKQIIIIAMSLISHKALPCIKKIRNSLT